MFWWFSKLRWRNADVNYLEKVRLDHNIFHPSGLSPQGYLLVEGDKLLVPNGRSMPAVFDRATGKLLDYIQGYRNGDCRVTVSGNYAFVGRDGVMDTPHAARGKQPLGGRGQGRPGARAVQQGPPLRGHDLSLQILPRLHRAIGLGRRCRLRFARRDLPGTRSRTCRAFGVRIADDGPGDRPWRWDPPLLWQLPTDLAANKPGDSAIIRAGSRLYGHTAETLVAWTCRPAAGQSPRSPGNNRWTGRRGTAGRRRQTVRRLKRVASPASVRRSASQNLSACPRAAGGRRQREAPRGGDSQGQRRRRGLLPAVGAGPGWACRATAPAISVEADRRRCRCPASPPPSRAIVGGGAVRRLSRGVLRPAGGVFLPALPRQPARGQVPVRRRGSRRPVVETMVQGAPALRGHGVPGTTSRSRLGRCCRRTKAARRRGKPNGRRRDHPPGRAFAAVGPLDP